MSTVILKNVQIGVSGTPTNNFTWYQPASPDGTVRLGVGNAGATTLDAVSVADTGVVNFPNGVQSGGTETLKDPGTGGILVRTALGVTTARGISGGTGISVANGFGISAGPTITNTGVTSIVAGTNITVSGATGAVTVNATSSAPSTAQVLSATAGATAGAVGTYSLLGVFTGGVSFNGTKAGSELRYTTISQNQDPSNIPAGTWRLMSSAQDGSGGVWLRIS